MNVETTMHSPMRMSGAVIARIVSMSEPKGDQVSASRHHRSIVDL